MADSDPEAALLAVAVTFEIGANDKDSTTDLEMWLKLPEDKTAAEWKVVKHAMQTNTKHMFQLEVAAPSVMKRAQIIGSYLQLRIKPVDPRGDFWRFNLAVKLTFTDLSTYEKRFEKTALDHVATKGMFPLA